MSTVTVPAVAPRPGDPAITEQAIAETKDGCLSWMLHALGVPDYPAVVHGYGSVIGTGKAVVSWVPPASNPPEARR